VTSNNDAYRPIIHDTFRPASGAFTGTATFVWRIGYNWDNNNEGTYRLFMQLGDSATMTAVPWHTASIQNRESLRMPLAETGAGGAAGTEPATRCPSAGRSPSGLRP
jgi:hypothetical protein